MTGKVMPRDGLKCGLSNDEATRLAKVFAALGDPSRLYIVSRMAAEPDGVYVADMVRPLQLNQATVTHHVRVLKAADLVVELPKEGAWRPKGLNLDAFAALADFLAAMAKQAAEAAKARGRRKA